MDYGQMAIELHAKYRGKIGVFSKIPLESELDLSLAYTPGVAAVCMEIAGDKAKAYELTNKGNMVAVVTDGSAVLGLGDIGPEGSMTVMEGKSLLFRELAGIDAWPICLDVHEADEIIMVVRSLAPTFGAINLEDIAAPKCFYIEDALQDIGIPVFHDDQHGTAVVVLAGLINSLKVVGKKFEDIKVVFNGAGAIGSPARRFFWRWVSLTLFWWTHEALSTRAMKGLHRSKKKSLWRRIPEASKGTFMRPSKGLMCLSAYPSQMFWTRAT